MGRQRAAESPWRGRVDVAPARVVGRLALEHGERMRIRLKPALLTPARVVDRGEDKRKAGRPIRPASWLTPFPHRAIVGLYAKR